LNVHVDIFRVCYNSLTQAECCVEQCLFYVWCYQSAESHFTEVIKAHGLYVKYRNNASFSGKINHQIKRAKLYICCVGFLYNWFQLNSHSMFNSTNTRNSTVLCAKVYDSNMDITCWLGGTRKGPVHGYAELPTGQSV